MTDLLSYPADPWGPERIVVVSDRRSGMRGVLVVDNTARGPGKGGTRMSPTLTVEEVARLARTMTWKWAANDLFFGGAKAGIAADPAMPRRDRERVLRGFARALAGEIPATYVFGLDMGLSEDDAAVVVDELGTRAASVGTPAELGGVPYDRLGVTGFGVAEAMDEAARLRGEGGGGTVAVQGFGAVGRAAARRAAELGYTVVAVSTAAGAVHDPRGLDVTALAALSAEHGDGCVDHVPDAARLAAGEELTVPVDVLLPCALQDVVDAAVAPRVRARLVVEGANMPLTAEARRSLTERGVTIVPDVVANAGGAIAAAHAMDARTSALRPDPAVIFEDITRRIRRNVGTVLAAAAADGVGTHEAAWRLARERVRAAMRVRGQAHD